MGFNLSGAGEEKIRGVLERYPNRQSALLPVLWIIQEEQGFISDEAIEYAAARLEVPESVVYGTVTFYTMFNRKKMGKNVIRVCTNICCWLRGSEQILLYLKNRLGISDGETTRDGRYSLLTVPCIGACGGAPAMMVGDEYFENLTFERIDEILRTASEK